MFKIFKRLTTKEVNHDCLSGDFCLLERLSKLENSRLYV